MAGFDAPGALNALYALVQGVEGLQWVQKGAPKTLPKRVAAFVALGSQTVGNKTSGTLEQRELRLYVGFGYRVQDAEGDAEDVLARVVDDVVRAVLADRTLGGTVASTKLEVAGSDDPRYRVLAGGEFRIYPMTLITTQYETITST